MTLIVSPELENRIQAKLQTGEYAGLDHLLLEALDSLDYQGEPETLEAFEAVMEEARGQADRGETYSGPEVRAFLAKASAERMRG